jgi:hypothetical protein
MTNISLHFEGVDDIQLRNLQAFMADQEAFISLVWDKKGRVLVIGHHLTPDKMARAGQHLTNKATEDLARINELKPDQDLSPGAWRQLVEKSLQKGRVNYSGADLR